MSLNKPLDQLTEADFQELIANKVPESKTLDYKVDLKFGDRDKREFLADVSSFANTAGGHLLIGIKEEGGIPTALPGIDLDNPDTEKLKLINLIRDCTQPRIPGVAITSVPLQNSRYILAIHIPKSWAVPHVVSIEKHWRFYARHSGGKYQLDVPELRQAFLMSESLAEKIRQFHSERVGMVISGEVPLNLANGPKFIAHIIPVDAFGSGQQVDMSMLMERGIHFNPLGASGYNRRYNLDGYLTYEEERTQDASHALSYTQLFRSGIIESVCVDKDHLNANERDRGIPITYYQEQLLRFLSASLQSLKQLEVEPPYSMMVTMAGVKHRYLHFGNRYFSLRNPYIDRDVLQLPDILIQDADFAGGKTMRPIFDAIWNAGGLERCFDYDEEGRWNGYGQ
uniref:Putative transcriptional regulator n=1 Tax=Geobacter sp. (strain M21) TaxID=443144 RepID=C6E2D2_GEOSM